MTKQKRSGKSFLSCILAVALLFSTLPTTVFADEAVANDDVGNLCEHHIEHDSTVCGYIAEVEGQECTHIHDDACYTEATVDSPATDSNVEEKVLSCPHVHDENCGNIEAVMGAHCVFKCEQCSPIDSGEGLPGINYVMITSFDELGEEIRQQGVAAKTPLTDLKLPDNLQVTGYTVAYDTVVLDSGTTNSAAIIIEGVVWEVDPTHELNMGTGGYDEQAEQGVYCFTPVLPEGYAIAADVALPEINVVVGGVNRLANGAILITNRNDLMMMDSGGSYVLANDIDLQGSNWTPLTLENFTFDGQGHSIYGFSAQSENAGLFGSVKGDVTIRNLTVRDASLSGKQLGALIGIVRAEASLSPSSVKLINCHSYNISFRGNNIVAYGGLIGMARWYPNVYMERCTGHAGLIGDIAGTLTMRQCFAMGSAEYNYYNREAGKHWFDIGGLVGNYNGGNGNDQRLEITDCYTKGGQSFTPTSMDIYSVGGFAGVIARSKSITIKNCYTLVDDENTTVRDWNNGAFVGAISNSSPPNVISCYYDKGITAQYAISSVGGDPIDLPSAAKTLEQLGQQSTYAGWDFTDTWSLDQTSLPIFRDGQSGGNPPDPATSITVSPLTLTLKIDETNDLVITTSPNELQYTCVSSDPEIANVTNEGIVTAKKEGSTTITVSLVDTPTEKARCTVTVLPLEPYDDLMCAIAASQLAYENALTGFDFGGTVAQFADAAIDPSRKLWESKANISLANFYKEVLGEWKIVGVTSYSSGLFAVALHNIEQNKTVIAFRGTETPKDLTTDILMGISNTLTTQFTDSIQFYNKYKGSGEVLLTGHSLGGSLAAHVSMNTGVRAEVFNAAIGWSLAGTYEQKMEDTLWNFTGIDQWNFVNHVTNSSSGINSAKLNELVAFKYGEKLPIRIYDVSAIGGKLNLHELNSMLEYDEQNKKFAFSPSSPWGNTSGSLQEFPPLAFGDLYTFGTSGADTVLRYSSTGLITSTRIFGGDGNDQLTTNIGGSDWLVSGTGSNALDGGAWNDSYFLIPCDGTQTINDPSGFDTIYLPSGVRVTNQTQSGEYIIVHLSNGQAVQVNAKRNFLAPAIEIRSMDGTDCGKLELKSRASRAAMQIPISTIEIDGNAVIKIVDESGNSVGTIDTTKDTFPRYENYGYFYFDDQTQHLSAILFNGAYQLEIINTESSIDYTILRHAEDDRPLTRAVAGGITLGIGNTLNTQTTFTGESTVPMTIKKSDGTESPVPYTVEDLTEAGDTSAVTGVIVTPKSVNVNKGATQKFIASVMGTGNYNNVVRWSVSGGAAGTQIDSNGKLTVAANETATLLTVTATSVQDSGKTDTAAVTVTDKPNVSLHQLTISGSHAQNTGEGAYAKGTKVSVDAGTKDGYNFNGWTSVGGGTFTDKKSRNTIFTMPGNDVTIVANWVSAGGDSNGGNTSGGGGGGNSNKPTITSTPDSAVLPAIGEIKVDGTVDKNGNTTVTVSDKAITDAINAAKKVAGENSISISIHVNLQQTANRLTVSISKVSLDKLIAEGVRDLKISSSLVNMSFNLEALKEIQKSAVGNINISAKKQNIKTLSAAAQTIIGNRPVFDFSMQSGDITITSFGKGTVSIWMPYALAANEIAGNVQAVYVDGRGTVSPIIGSSYDVITKMMLFSTSHFSIYGVGYKQDAPKFIDISNHWAKDSIEFVAARGMLTGTGGNAFSPDSPITRGMFVTALGRLANADVSGNKISSFTDVNAGTYYLSYIEWAVKNNIVQGMGNGTFAPDQAISREQMAVMTQNYAKAIGFNLPKVHAENTFADSAKIGGYAKNAVKAMQMAGILAGKNGNNFDPQGTATRAEVSALLQRFVELAISTGSAQGWMMNDSGKWMFYENGRPITGKKNIGGVSYVFDQNGEISDMPKNLTYGSYTVKSGDSFWKIAEVYKCNVYELARTNGKTIFSIIHPGEVLKILPQ